MNNAPPESTSSNNDSPGSLPHQGESQLEEPGIDRMKPSPTDASSDNNNNGTNKSTSENGRSNEIDGGDDVASDRAKHAIPADQAVDAVRASIGKRLRVTLTDDRTIEGTLECFDNSGNMILSGATNISSRRIFRLGNVLVPGPVATRIVRARPAPRGAARGATRGLDQLSIHDDDESGTGR